MANMINIKNELRKLYSSGNVKNSDIIKVLIENGFNVTDCENPILIYELQETIRIINAEKKQSQSVFFESIKLNDIKKGKEGNLNWRIRHYSSSTDHKTIESALKLAIRAGEVSSQSIHTESNDWTKFGNMGNTFFFLCIEDVVINANPGFIKDSKYYAEYDLCKIDHAWISNDWISMKPENEDRVFKGTGKQLCDYLSSLVGIMKGPEQIKSVILCKYPSLEIKIPHSMEVHEWKI